MKKLIAIDRPRAGVPVRRYDGWLEVSGWAAASEPIHDIRARAGRDGEWARAVYCLPRPDVQAAHPKLPNSARAGFQAFVPASAKADSIEVEVRAGRKSVSYGATVKIASDVREIVVADSGLSSCPWCGVDAARFVEPVTRGPFRLRSCGRCEFGFADPLPAAADLGAIYETEYWDHAPHGPDVLSPSHDSDLVHGFLERLGNGGQRVLEIGCGQGTLLYGLKLRGLDVAGQDLSQNSARTLEREHGVRIWRDQIGSVATDERYDCIVSRHVLEHSITPRADLEWMREHLAPGGIIVLLTPNRRSLAAEVLGATWEWFVPPIHVGYFAPRSIRVVADALGLAVMVQTSREGDGAALVPTLTAFFDYENERMADWQRERCSELVAAGSGGIEALMAKGGGAAGLGQEMITVLRTE